MSGNIYFKIGPTASGSELTFDDTGQLMVDEAPLPREVSSLGGGIIIDSTDPSNPLISFVPRAAPEVVQVALNHTATWDTDTSVTLDSSPTTGNLLLAIVCSNSEAPESIAWTLPDGWTGLAGQSVQTNILRQVQLGMRPVVDGDDTSIDIGTVGNDSSGGATGFGVILYEVTGADATIPVAGVVVDAPATPGIPFAELSEPINVPVDGLAICVLSFIGNAPAIGGGAVPIPDTFDITSSFPTAGNMASYHATASGVSEAFGSIHCTQANDTNQAVVQAFIVLQGPVDYSSGSGIVRSVVAGDGIDVDSTDPANPVVSTPAVSNPYARMEFGSQITPGFQHFGTGLQNFVYRGGNINDSPDVVHLFREDGDGNSDIVFFQEGGDFDIYTRFDLMPQHGANYLSVQPFTPGNSTEFWGGDAFVRNFFFNDGNDWQAMFLWRIRIAPGTLLAMPFALQGQSSPEEVGDGGMDVQRNAFWTPSADTIRAWTIGDVGATVPLTVVTGVNDEFVYTPAATGIPETFTMAGGTYSTLSGLVTAVGAAVGVSSEAFSGLVNVNSIGTAGLLFLEAVTAGPTHNDDTITFGANDVAASLGFTANPDAFAWGV